MGLRLAEIAKDTCELRIHRKFESMGENLVLLKLTISPRNASPLHWYLENNRKPPFDVAINPQNGLFNYLTFFFQDEKLKRCNILFPYDLKQNYGIPRFDISLFTEKEYQMFEEGILESYFDGKNIYLTTSIFQIYYCLNLTLDNAILFDRENQIVGVLFRNLSEEELGELLRAKILGDD